MNQNGPYVVWLEQAEEGSSSLLGGKCSSLAEMVQAGFGVPPAFAVTTRAYSDFMDQDGLLDAARKVRAESDPENLDEIERASSEITQRIESTPMPPVVAEAVRAAYAELCERAGVDAVPVAVRSSGVAEDLAGASFAGQYETYLWITGADAVIEHVRRCWTGLFGPQVLTYRPEGDTPGQEEIGMAVGVQQMVAARAAGVMFTLDPVTGDRSKIVIEGAWGLGEAVVSGLVTPDRYRVDKVTLELLTSEVADKAQEFRFEPGAGVGLRDVPEPRRTQACLADEQVVALAMLAKRIERHRGAPQDIEWAVDEHGEVHVLQVRPETVWSRRAAKPIATGRTAMDMVIGKFMAGAAATQDKTGRTG
ncbi:MAG TPA: PEP/pyruvate-binding domain-containing protein [Solirubrobacteraceae bacterium]|jgi:pyruvate,water dikinase